MLFRLIGSGFVLLARSTICCLLADAVLLRVRYSWLRVAFALGAVICLLEGADLSEIVEVGVVAQFNVVGVVCVSGVAVEMGLCAV